MLDLSNTDVIAVYVGTTTIFGGDITCPAEVIPFNPTIGQTTTHLVTSLHHNISNDELKQHVEVYNLFQCA
jgi:hypothetical protein